MTNNKNFFYASSSDFKKIPGSPIAYWVSERMKEVFDNPKIEDVTISDGQTKTGDNDKYLRMLWEVNKSTIGKEKKWVKHPKGGTFRRWYGNVDSLIDWSEESRLHYRKDRVARILPEYLWWRKGFCWTLITSGSQSFRLVNNDEIFNLAAPTLFPKEEIELLFFLGLVNTPIASYIAKMMNPTLNMNVGEIQSIPLIDVDKTIIDKLVNKLVNIAKSDWDNFETSWDFTDLPLLRNEIRSANLAESWQNYQSYSQDMTQEMQRMEEENNRIFIEAYGLQDELTPEVPLKEITLTGNPIYRYGEGKTEEEYEQRFRQDTVKEFISYAIGCMMGRYSLDRPGLILANAGETAEDYRKIVPDSSFPADEDAIIPLLDTEYFHDDGAGRLVEFLRVTYGESTIEENLRFIADALKPGSSNAPMEVIRDYLAKDFFKDHMRTYKKRPIYWLFSSGKEKGFQALVYMHRYTPATIPRLRTHYLHELQNKLRHRADELPTLIEDAESTSLRNRYNKELEKINKQMEELRQYDEKLRHLADQRIEIDLDDGVKHNYGLFGDILAEVKGITGEK